MPENSCLFYDLQTIFKNEQKNKIFISKRIGIMMFALKMENNTQANIDSCWVEQRQFKSQEHKDIKFTDPRTHEFEISDWKMLSHF